MPAPGNSCTAIQFDATRTLYRLLAALSQAPALEDVYEAAISALLDATGADRAAVLLFDDHGVMRFKASRGLSPEYQAAVTGHSPWPQGARDARTVAVPQVQKNPSLAAYQEVLERERIRALAFVPLALESGVIGKFMLYYPQPHEFDGDELEIAEAIAPHVAMAARRQQFEEASRYLAAIVENSDDAIISKDLNCIVTSWNKGAERIFGYTAEEMIGRPISVLASPELPHESFEIVAQIRQGKRIHHYETRRRHKDGRMIDISLTVSPIRDASGRIVGASKIARDISERKAVEQERVVLLEREKEARRTAELLNRIAPRLVAQLDIEKLTQEVTDISTSLVGAEVGAFFHNLANEAAERPSHALSGELPESFERSITSPGADLFGPAFRQVLRCEDLAEEPASAAGTPFGHLAVRSYLAAPVIARSGELLGGLFFGHTQPGKFNPGHEALITGVAAQSAIALDNARLFEQMQWVQTELKRSNEDLRRANRDLEVFAYSASHDLKEPLRTITLFAELMERRGKLDRQTSDSLERIVSAASRMNTLISDLLAYTQAAKAEEGPAPRVDSGRVLASVIQILCAAVQEAGATVIYGKLPPVTIHETRLAQLFQNLIANAIKYRGTEPPRIEVTAEERDGWCVFSVIDNGIGIDPRYAQQVFGLFKRLHRRDEYPGNGIGLSICERIVEHYGGRIWLEQSTPGEGSTFCFALPSCAARE